MQIDSLPMPPSAAPLARRAGIVLVVDDEPLLGRMMSWGLAHSGLDAEVAASPAEALDLARRSPIALLVTDLMMPGMTGIELAGKLRRLQPRVPVLLVSGTPDAGTLPLEAPSAFLAKPFSLGALALTAATLMADPPRPTGAAAPATTGVVAGPVPEPGAHPMHIADVLAEWRHAERLWLAADRSSEEGARLADWMAVLCEQYQALARRAAAAHSGEPTPRSGAAGPR